jgi:hypothetical protein
MSICSRSSYPVLCYASSRRMVCLFGACRSMPYMPAQHYHTLGCMTSGYAVHHCNAHTSACRERAGNSKHVQLVSGARPWLFWLSTYAFDLASYALSGAGIIILVAVYRLPQYQVKGKGGRNMRSLICLGTSCPCGASYTARVPTITLVGCKHE